LLLGLCGFAGAQAQKVVEDSTDAGQANDKSIIIPYAFSTETLSTGVGAAWVQPSRDQPQQLGYLTGYYTANNSYAIFAGIKDRQIFSDRLYFSPLVGVTWNQDQRFYGELFFRQGTGGSGSNESSPTDFVSGEGTDSYVHLQFRYLLPIGTGKDTALHTYHTTDGILTGGATNGQSWNPFKGGRTFLEIRPFYQKRSIDVTTENIGQFPPATGIGVGDTAKTVTNGITAILEYDNRDFPVNPVRGSHTRLEVDRDFGAFESTTSWTALEASIAKYLGFGDSGWFEQRVLALNAWTAYVPTWEVRSIGGGLFEIDNRPPSNLGATLGGPKRMRAYPLGRFNDKAAVYYSAEFRLIPRWNPLKKWPLIRKWPWRWWQWVGFGEVGRVATDWNFSTLHEDMKWSYGLGLRAMIGGGIMRLDFAISDESRQVVAFFGHTF
jgi:hypothetical protein